MLKTAVRDFWNIEPCGSRYFGSFEIHSRVRFTLEPHIREFAKFEDAKGLRVLEVGVGTGGDYVEWLKAGADATGIDLSFRSIEYATERCRSYGLTPKLRVADAEALPFRGGTFDLVYSYGVMHHSPDTEQCIREAYRVLRPGGQLRIMVYHHPSFVGFMLWLRYGIIERCGIRKAVYRHLESPGTKSYTAKEALKMLAGFDHFEMRQVFSPGDLLMNQPSSNFQSTLYRLVWKVYPRWLARRFSSMGLFLLISATKL